MLQSKAANRRADEHEERHERGQSFPRIPRRSPSGPALSPDSSAYRELVAIAAYYRAERRGFAPGGELEDWLDAEREVAARLGEAQSRVEKLSARRRFARRFDKLLT